MLPFGGKMLKFVISKPVWITQNPTMDESWSQAKWVLEGFKDE